MILGKREQEMSILIFASQPSGKPTSYAIKLNVHPGRKTLPLRALYEVVFYSHIFIFKLVENLLFNCRFKKSTSQEKILAFLMKKIEFSNLEVEILESLYRIRTYRTNKMQENASRAALLKKNIPRMCGIGFRQREST